jgi:hypothetical protein
MEYHCYSDNYYLTDLYPEDAWFECRPEDKNAYLYFLSHAMLSYPQMLRPPCGIYIEGAS